MKVTKRTQVTEVTTKRQVCHTVKLGNSTFNRIELVTIVLPYMDCEAIVSKPIVKWNIEEGSNTVRYLSKKELKVLRLEDWFAKIDLDSKNGNG